MLATGIFIIIIIIIISSPEPKAHNVSLYSIPIEPASVGLAVHTFKH